MPSVSCSEDHPDLHKTQSADDMENAVTVWKQMQDTDVSFRTPFQKIGDTRNFGDFVKLISEPPLPKNLVIISLINVKSCNAVLLMLLVRTRSFLKKHLTHKFLILDSYHFTMQFLSWEFKKCLNSVSILLPTST
jgi:hypothetical protein